MASRYEELSGRCILNVFDSCHFADSPGFIVAKCSVSGLVLVSCGPWSVLACNGIVKTR